MNNAINNLFVAAIGGHDPERLITAVFRDGQSATYPAGLAEELKKDNFVDVVIDTETGEVL